MNEHDQNFQFPDKSNSKIKLDKQVIDEMIECLKGKIKLNGSKPFEYDAGKSKVKVLHHIEEPSPKSIIKLNK